MLDTERSRSGSGCIFLLAWAAATIFGFLAGGWLGDAIEGIFFGPDPQRLLSIEGRVEMAQPLDYLVSVVGGLAAGLVLGLSQGLVLRPYFKESGMIAWIAATTIGRTVQWVALFAISQQLVELVVDKNFNGVVLLLAILVGMGIIAGLAIGYPQTLVWRGRVNRPVWWLLANLPGPIFIALVVCLTLYIEGANLVRDWTSPLLAIITAGLTGVALNELLSRPTPDAEWYRDRRF